MDVFTLLGDMIKAHAFSYAVGAMDPTLFVEEAVPRRSGYSVQGSWLRLF